MRAPGSVVTLYHLNQTLEAQVALRARWSPMLKAETNLPTSVRVCAGVQPTRGGVAGCDGAADRNSKAVATTDAVTVSFACASVLKVRLTKVQTTAASCSVAAPQSESSRTRR